MSVFTAADRARPGFSIAMELLCSLPKSPTVVPLSVLRRDLNLDTQAEALEIIDGLKEAGFRIRITHADGWRGMVGYVTPQGWDPVQVAADNYWETVWGVMRHTAQDLGGPAVAPSTAA